ncbi:MAG: DNA-directed RNA polymerase subunit omega, partial [Lachnospiraceae bacterium]|nr:DNA-directed RNA polymerase subunit omega [Lachnospiraceae bacterium]
EGTDVGEEPVVNSRYSIVCATAKRARQIIDGKEPLIDYHEKDKPLSIAVNELYEGELKILTDEEAEEMAEKEKKVKEVIRQRREEAEALARQQEEKEKASEEESEENPDAVEAEADDTVADEDAEPADEASEDTDESDS